MSRRELNGRSVGAGDRWYVGARDSISLLHQYLSVAPACDTNTNTDTDTDADTNTDTDTDTDTETNTDTDTDTDRDTGVARMCSGDKLSDLHLQTVGPAYILYRPTDITMHTHT